MSGPAKSNSDVAGRAARAATDPNGPTGRLATWLATGATTPEQKLQAFRNACGWMSCIFLLGLLVLPFAPETRGRPMPED